MSQQETGGPAGGPPPLSEEELRAQLEAELKRLRVEDVVVQTVVSLLNLGARRAGLTGAGDDEVDLPQVQSAIEAVQALMPTLEKAPAGGDVGPIRDALAQLQLAYARGGSRSTDAPPAGEGPPGQAGDRPSEEDPGKGPGPAQSSGRLWVPGS